MYLYFRFQGLISLSSGCGVKGPLPVLVARGFVYTPVPVRSLLTGSGASGVKLIPQACLAAAVENPDPAARPHAATAQLAARARQWPGWASGSVASLAQSHRHQARESGRGENLP